MESVKELTEKIKKLNKECFTVRCYYNSFDDGTDLFAIDLKNYDKLELKVLVYIYKERVVLEFQEYTSLFKHYRKEFKEETYTKAEKAELLSVLSLLNEYSDNELLMKFNSFLHE